VYVFGWISFGLGIAGIGPGGLHVQVNPNVNPLVDSIVLAGQDIQVTDGAVERAMRDIDGNPTLGNVRVPGRGSPLNAAVGTLSISLDGAINGDPRRQSDRIRIVRALVARGGHLRPGEATDLRKTWILRRALYDGPITTESENSLVWRIITHNRG